MLNIHFILSITTSLWLDLLEFITFMYLPYFKKGSTTYRSCSSYWMVVFLFNYQFFLSLFRFSTRHRSYFANTRRYSRRPTISCAYSLTEYKICFYFLQKHIDTPCAKIYVIFKLRFSKRIQQNYGTTWDLINRIENFDFVSRTLQGMFNRNIWLMNPWTKMIRKCRDYPKLQNIKRTKRHKVYREY